MATKKKAKSTPEPELTQEELAQLSGEGETSTAVAERESATDLMFKSNEDVSGSADDVQMKLPRLNLVQKVGPLADEFNKGEIVLNSEEVLVDGTKTGLEVTVVKAHFFYEEWLDYGNDRIPERAKDANEVNSRGGNLDWENDPKTGKGIRPSWRQVAEVLFAVKAPEGQEDNPSFPFEFDGDTEEKGMYTFALLKLKGASFNSAGREIITAKNFYYRGNVSSGSFLMTSPLVPFRTGNSAYVCTLKKHKKHTDAFLDWLRDYQP